MPRVATLLLFALGLLVATIGGYTYAMTDTSQVLPSPPQEGEVRICAPGIDFGTMGRKIGRGALALLGAVTASAAFVSLVRKKTT